MAERVFPIEDQEPGHCGPTSLSMCLAILGIEATQRDLARAAGKPFKIYVDGLDEHEIKRAASAYGGRCDFASERSNTKGAAFAAGLRKQLKTGLPLMLIVSDFAHWVAVVGYVDDKFIIMDPADGDLTFNRWSERTLLQNAWCEDDDEDDPEPSQFFAILTRRADGAPPRWKVSRAFLRLCEEGSDETAEQMANDLVEMVRRAQHSKVPIDEGILLATVLAEYETTIDSVWHWTTSAKVSKRDVLQLYRDYTTVAAATGLRWPPGLDRAELVAQLTTVMTTYVWLGEL